MDGGAEAQALGFQALGAFLSFPLTQGSWPARPQDAGGGTFPHPGARWVWAWGPGRSAPGLSTGPCPSGRGLRGAAERAVAAAGGLLLPLSRPAAWNGHRRPQAAALVPVRVALAAESLRSRRARSPEPASPSPPPHVLPVLPRARCSVPTPFRCVAALVVPSLSSSEVTPRGTSDCSSASASGGFVCSHASLPACCWQVGVAGCVDTAPQPQPGGLPGGMVYV